MNSTTRIYLDNAATSWPKPEGVYDAVDRYQRQCGAAAGRGGYREAIEVARAVDACRKSLASWIGVQQPERIIFTLNGTDALNLALHGLLQSGDHVVTTVAEHNSVLRPLRRLETTGQVSVTRVACDSRGIVAAEDIAAALTPRTRLVAMTHASNVTGALQPVEAVGRLLADHSAHFLVDAAQSLGHVKLDARATGIDLLAAPGHKGLLGPLGTGFLYVAEGMEAALQCVRQGGTGSRSEEDRQPDLLPDKYEAGNLNVPGIVGLAAGLDFLRERGIEALRQHEQELTAQLLAGLVDVPSVRIVGPADASQQVGVVSVTLDGYDSQAVAAMLDGSYRVQCRAGIQCAPLMHRAMGTSDSGGTIRFSVGPFTTGDQIETATGAIAEIAASAANL
jgi:cysteine desulfurase family protein